MIETNTVLILGAGANKYYYFPTGEDLRNEIIANFRNWYQKHIPPSTPNESWSKMTEPEKNIELRNIDQFIDDFDEAACQIDVFITRNRHDKNYTILGKLAIILGIYESELISRFPNDQNEDWYRELFTQLTSDMMNPDAYKISQNNVSFITFNYDRSLEHYLYKTLKRNFLSIDDQDIIKEINKVPVVHVYGKIAPLDWQNDDGIKLKYRLDREPLGNTALQMIENIYVIHDDRENSNAEKASKIIGGANRVYFLGFGYYKDNLDILGIPNRLRNATHIFGTALKFSSARVDLIKQQYFLTRRRVRCKIDNSNCYKLLKDYPLTV